MSSVVSPIPKIIHQTWKSRDLPAYLKGFVDTWKNLNPGWEHRFYDDQDCLDFIKKTCPQYLEAYQSLTIPVEKADFFRYLVVYYIGGVYADTDTSCQQPIDDWLKEGDQVVVGLESDTTIKKMKRYELPRQKQYCQWVFASRPKTPLLKSVIDAVISNAPNRDMPTLLKTGPDVFTQAVEEHFSDPGVRTLEIECFGSGQYHSQKVIIRRKNIYVIHHFFGSWKPNVNRTMTLKYAMRRHRRRSWQRLKSLETWRR